ncbi:thiamine ABC transporter ATP-binding protein [Lacibacterium aquatile]|uniref:Thiamine ABC transporter ATP-binding protein n=1 Tax=Lacibacterium aquatile TaxID=1168082 RepID=A0ABW5DT96_9PROT
MADAIALKAVSFVYDGFPMSFDLRVEAGTLLALIGPSGAGKSTLLNLIAGFERPSAGKIHLMGEDVTALPSAKRPVTTLFQDNNLFTHLDVQTNIALGVDPRGRLTAAEKTAVSAALEQVDLTGFERRLPSELSGGQRQRVALARALVMDRPILALDEPFAALGPAQRREMLGLIDEMRRTRGLTVLLVSHHPDEARLAADRTAFIDKGRVVAEDRTDLLLARIDLPGLTDYLGDYD